jgi:hypothetical protein
MRFLPMDAVRYSIDDRLVRNRLSQRQEIHVEWHVLRDHHDHLFFGIDKHLGAGRTGPSELADRINDTGAAMTYGSVATWCVACAAIGTGAWLVFGNGIVASPVAQEALGPPLLEPQMIVASNGMVALTLEAAPSVITVRDSTFI